MIRKTLVLFLLVSAMAFTQGFAQERAIKVNILSPIVRTVSVFYENAVSDQSSLQIGFYYTGASISETKFRGFGITPEYRFYLSETSAIEGFYIAPFLRYSNLDISEGISGDEGTLSSIGGGLVIGRQWVFKEKVTVDLFIGPQYVNGSLKVTNGEGGSFDTGVFDGFGVRPGVTIGFAL